MESSKDPYTENLNFIERKGLDFLRRTSRRDENAVDMWSDEQIAEIRGIERRALWLAVITGAISGAVIAGLELGLSNWIVDAESTY